MSRTSGEDANARAAAAAQRAAELQERLAALRAGRPTTAEDVQRAEQAARQERQQGMTAYRRAAEAHRESARGHRLASELLDALGQPAQAAEHRRKAMLDDAAARRDTDAAARGRLLS